MNLRHPKDWVQAALTYLYLIESTVTLLLVLAVKRTYLTLNKIKGSEGRSLKVFYELGFSEGRVPHYRSRCHDDFLLIFLPSILLCLFV